MRETLGLGLNIGPVTTNYMASGNLLEISKPQCLHLKMETSMSTYRVCNCIKFLLKGA